MTNSIILALRIFLAPRGLPKLFTNGPPQKREASAERRMVVAASAQQAERRLRCA